MMNIVYLIGVVIILKFAHSVYKGRGVDAKQLPINCNSETDIIDIKPSIETPPEIPVEIPKSLGKNT
ncbi:MULTISPECIES: hypothetical protein [unclassified Flavobacterium]|uniref:hypothetical protein n=1 Tax=unclassified Flavobacterium TaxID=196869 RepID=UPI0025BD9267|nr:MULTISPECIES: hypothetical protein [unclassified Flavobacterium]